MASFKLQLLHAADQEAGIPALTDAPRFSAVLNALKNQDLDNDGVVGFKNTIVLSSGDAYIPGAFLNASQTAFGGVGRGDILIQNELGFQAIAFGNHEFDLGTAIVRDLIAGGSTFAGANFPYLSGNLNFAPDSNLASLVVPDGNAPKPKSITGSVVIDVNGEKIGVVGATTPTLRTISSPGNVGVTPTPFGGNPSAAELDALAAVIQTDVNALLSANPGINKVILLAHMQQIAIEQALATRLKNVDIIVAGGSNTRLFDSNDRLRAGDTNQGVYPIVRNDADGKPVAIVNTDGNYKYVGRLVIDFDANGNIIPGSYDPTISGAYATDAQGVAALNAGGLVDPEIQAIVNQLSTVIAAADGAIFGKTNVFLNGDRSSVRAQETNFGNLTADANLAIAKQYDASVVLSLKNGGGIRDNIGIVTFPPGSTNPADALRLPPVANELAGKQEGDISQLDIANSLRFNNGLSLVTVSASQLKDLMEHGVAGANPGATPGSFPQVGGFSFSFDATRTARSTPGTGDRIRSLAIVDANNKVVEAVVENGEVVGDPTRTFRMVTLGFLATGGDGYPFPTGTAANVINLTQSATAPRTGVATFAADASEQDALAEYLAANFLTKPFNVSDTAPALDTRIQNLAFRSDSVIPVNFGFENAITGLGNLFGTSGDESFLSTTNNVSIYAGEGQNKIKVTGSNATIYAGAAKDEITVVNGVVYAGEGENTITATGGATQVYGGASKDVIKLASGNNTVYAGEGDNQITTGAGNDVIYAGAGNDRILTGAGDDLIYAGEGNNFVNAGSGNDQVYSGWGQDTFVLNAGAGFVTIYGVQSFDRFSLGAGVTAADLQFTKTQGDTIVSAKGDQLALLKWSQVDSLTLV
ncbi:MAG: 5'-nucleotidase C-terminal domain-containing protein [Synechococcales bacterium]|nr:5'-nucleotidase C-terminal domain-containing protein [Synechococcales bacterium]